MKQKIPAGNQHVRSCPGTHNPHRVCFRIVVTSVLCWARGKGCGNKLGEIWEAPHLPFPMYSPNSFLAHTLFHPLMSRCNLTDKDTHSHLPGDFFLGSPAQSQTVYFKKLKTKYTLMEYAFSFKLWDVLGKCLHFHIYHVKYPSSLH